MDVKRKTPHMKWLSKMVIDHGLRKNLSYDSYVTLHLNQGLDRTNLLTPEQYALSKLTRLIEG
jgi:hypothetical protein